MQTATPASRSPSNSNISSSTRGSRCSTLRNHTQGRVITSEAAVSGAQPMSDDVDHAWDLMEEIQICMMVTFDGRNLRSRPMGAYVRRHERCIHFLTDIRHHKDEEIAASRQVCLAFADISGEKYVSATGEARILDDRAKVKELWSTPAKAWWETPD